MVTVSVSDRRVERDVVEAVLGGVVGDDDGGEDFGDVVLGFAGKVVALVELPEVGVAGLLDRALNVAGAPVVAGHGEIPVAKLRVDVLHVAGVGAGGFFGIEALVDVVVAGEAVVAIGHELPHAAGAGAGVDGAGLEAGLGDGEIDEVLRNAFFAHDALNHRPVAAGALEGVEQGVVALGGVGEEVDVGGDVVVDDERKVGLGGGEIGVGLGHDVGIDDESDIAGGFGGRVLGLGSEAVALLQGVHLETVDLVDDAVEFVLERRGRFDVDSAGKHEIDGVVEV